MEKFSKKYLEYFHDLPFSYFSTPIYLNFAGYVLWRNNEPLLVTQDIYYPHEFPALFLPQSPENWQNCSVTFGRESDIEKIERENIEIRLRIEAGTEFYYETAQFIKPSSDFKRRVEQFKKNYDYKIIHRYPAKKIADFYAKWKNQKPRNAATFPESEEFFYYCLKNLSRYQIKQVYAEVNGKLVGFAWGIAHPSGGWVGLELKVDYSVKGLSRFLHHARAKLFKNRKIFTLGTGAHEPGILQYKIELHSYRQVKYYYILTGRKSL